MSINWCIKPAQLCHVEVEVGVGGSLRVHVRVLEIFLATEIAPTIRSCPLLPLTGLVAVLPSHDCD